MREGGRERRENRASPGDTYGGESQVERCDSVKSEKRPRHWLKVQSQLAFSCLVM